MTNTYPSIYTLQRGKQPSDGVVTPTLKEQRETEFAIAEVLDDHQDASLRSGEHVQFLSSTLFSLPAGFVALDASKPWLMFWTFHSYDLLGVLIPQDIKDRATSTILQFLSPKGGFAGGAADTHSPHLLPTYAAALSLAIVGNAGQTGGWDRLVEARQGVYDFFMRCKQSDGSFVVCDGGEVDVRGTYCALIVASLLDIVTPELVHNVDKFIAGCQTYEGGFACSSFGGEAMAEAHGGYTSCSIFSHFLLSSVQPPKRLESLSADFPVAIDVDSAIRWSALMQGDAGEAGGFRGRANKLVDGCYSWWVGGSFPILEELRRREHEANEESSTEGARIEDGDEWADEATTAFNRVALQEYVLIAGQREGGGLRDKPGKRPDLYHTCNVLSGLSVAQHHMVHTPEKVESFRKSFKADKSWPAIKPTKPEGGWKSEDERQAARREIWANIRGWVEDPKGDLIIGGPASRVNATVPPFNLIAMRLNNFANYFYCQ